MMICSAKDCPHDAQFRFTWPGSPEQEQCAAHASAALRVADSMGFALEVKLLEWPPITEAERLEALELLGAPDAAVVLRGLAPAGLAHVDGVVLGLRADRRRRAAPAAVATTSRGSLRGTFCPKCSALLRTGEQCDHCDWKAS